MREDAGRNFGSEYYLGEKIGEYKKIGGKIWAKYIRYGMRDITFGEQQFFGWKGQLIEEVKNFGSENIIGEGKKIFRVNFVWGASSFREQVLLGSKFFWVEKYGKVNEYQRSRSLFDLGQRSLRFKK